MTPWLLHRGGMRQAKALPEMYEILNETRSTHVEYCKTYDALVALGWPPNWTDIVCTSTPMRCHHLLNYSEETPPAGGSRTRMAA